MNDPAVKLAVLRDVARAFNAHGVTWAVGGSLLLYFRGRTDVFHDLDLMVCEADVETAKALLLSMGRLDPPHPSPGFLTRHFLEFTVRGVDVDVLAGMVIVHEGVAHDCALRPEQIDGRIELDGEAVPLQSLADWRMYYAWMGRTAKVELIDAPSSPAPHSKGGE